MIASNRPATPRGPSVGEGASGFGDLLAELRSQEGDEGAVSPTERPARPGAAERTSADDGSGPLVLPGPGTKEPEPQVLQEVETGEGAESLVVSGVVDAKAPEPQILPDPLTENAELLVLPGNANPEKSEPQAPPGTEPGKGSEPQILPDGMVARDLAPQVLPGVTEGKTPQPQVLPGVTGGKTPGSQVLPGVAEGKPPRPQVLSDTDPVEVAPPVSGAGDATQAAADGALRPGPAPAGAHSLQPVSLPLKPLAERTSKPLDEAQSAPAPSAGDAKTTTPTTSTAPAAAPPVKPVPQAAPTSPAPQADRSTPTPEEAPSTSAATTSSTETAVPVRDHGLSTLSRASIDATAQIAAQIQRRLEGRSTRFEIALRPAELGRVDVKLDIDSEGRLAARLAFDNPAAATDLRGRVDDLRRQLEAAGFELADDAFEFAERDSGSSAFDRGQDARHGQTRAFAAAARLKTEIDVAQPPQRLALSLSPSGVDLKV